MQLQTIIFRALLSECGSWMGIGKKIYETVEEIQSEYLCMIYCAPSTPKRALGSQAGMLNSKHRILIEKVGLLSEILQNKEEQEETYPPPPPNNNLLK